MHRWVPPVFPKIPHYRGEADLVCSLRRVVCLEKIDGTNTRIGVPHNAKTPEDIVIGGREKMSWEEGFSQPFLLELLRDLELCKRLLAAAANLQKDLVLYGETCGSKIQSMGFLYGPKTHFLLFGARVGGVWLSYQTPLLTPVEDAEGSEEVETRRATLPSLVQLSEMVRLPLTPCVYEGPPDPEVLSSLVERPSQHSIEQGFRRDDVDNSQEGIVIWGDPLLLEPFGDPVVAKYKHPRRREALPAPKTATGVEGPQDFAKRVVLPERLKHAISYLKENGKWSEDNAQNQEATTRRVIQDIAREVPEYQEQLGRHNKKELRRVLEEEASRVFATISPDEEPPTE